MSPRRLQESKNEPQERPTKDPWRPQITAQRRKEPKRLNFCRFLTPRSAPRHDSTALLGVRLEKNIDLRRQKYCKLRSFTFEKPEILRFGCIFEVIFSAKPRFWFWC